MPLPPFFTILSINLGMVSVALWTDFKGDNLPDLIMVGEWMPLTLFVNKNGNLKNISEEVGLKTPKDGGIRFPKWILIRMVIWIMWLEISDSILN